MKDNSNEKDNSIEKRKTKPKQHLVDYYYYDPYKETNVRLMGYGHCVGESLHFGFPGAVSLRVCYGITVLYVIGDVMDKFVNYSFLHGVDALLWQHFATMAIPPITILKLCRFVEGATKKNANGPILTTVVGLVAIPVIMPVIDSFIHFIMDLTFRPFFNVRRRD